MFGLIRKANKVAYSRVSRETLDVGTRKENLDESEAVTIVNEYGEALLKVNALNGVEVLGVISSMKRDEELCRRVSESLNRKRGYYFDLFSRKFDKSLLPYPKERIRNAIEFLLTLDSDPDNIRLLKAGLEYLDCFE